MPTTAANDHLVDEELLASLDECSLRDRSEGRASVTKLDEQAQGIDMTRAWRTVPLGQNATDPSRTPGVDVEVWVLHVRYRRTSARDDLAALVREYSSYALGIARRLHRDGEAQEDLDQVALLALVTSLQRFDPDRGLPFAAFATPTIAGAIKRHYRDHGWALRTPRHVHELAGPVRTTRERLTAALGRSATTSEVATALGLDDDRVRSVERAVAARSTSSLDRSVFADGTTIADTLTMVDDRLDRTDTRLALADAMASLSDRDREVVALYFMEDLSQKTIAERYGVSQMQVSRWLTSIMKRLRVRMQA